MNLENFVQGLTIQEREELLDILLQNTENSTTMPPHIKELVDTDTGKEDFTMKPSNVKDARRQKVSAKSNTWTDTGEHRDISTPDVQKTPRNRPAPKKKKVRCHVCNKEHIVNASIVYGEYYRCDSCVGR